MRILHDDAASLFGATNTNIVVRTVTRAAVAASPRLRKWPITAPKPLPRTPAPALSYRVNIDFSFLLTVYVILSDICGRTISLYPL